MANENLSPDMAARILRYHPTEAQRAKSTSASPYQVCLFFSEGSFIMTWSAASIGKYDWVALYSSTDAGNEKYVAYQWAINGPTYNTGISVQSNYQARYLSWDEATKTYVAVANTQGFPNTSVCSS